MSTPARYVLISPCRDEARFLRQAIESVLRQTVPPALWVIVDDGSVDETPIILKEYADAHPWIRIIRRAGGGRRSVGPGVVDAFYSGYESIDPRAFEFVCKLDLDLELPNIYFERLIERMHGNRRIGTCSGKPYYRHPKSRKFVSERCGDETSVGMTKFYRIECFEEIGGFVRQVMWDGIDCHRCRMLGWIACSWDEPELRFEHLRPMGSSQGSILQGRMRHGFGQYFMGTGLVYFLVSALYRFSHHPPVIGGAAMFWGYLRSMLRREPRYDDAEFGKFLRCYQRMCLLYGKRKATALSVAAGESTWTGRRFMQPRSAEIGRLIG